MPLGLYPLGITATMEEHCLPWCSEAVGDVYDETGSPAGINVNGGAYFFVKNLQGDVTAIVSYNGTVICKYYYDAYGYPIYVKDANGANITSETHIALLNPFRYRGYMYDEETCFYYLRTRYYDPYIGRFLNADDTAVTAANLGSAKYDKNLFAYCDNNPVVRADDGGEFWHIAVGAIVGAVVSGVTKVVSNVVEGKKWSDGLDFAITTGAISGAVSVVVPSASVVVNATLSATESLAEGIASKKSVQEITVDAVTSAALGAVAGSGNSSFAKNSIIDDGIKAISKSFSPNHPVVKKESNKLVKKLFRYIAKEGLTDQVDSLFMEATASGSSWFANKIINTYREHS